MSRARLLALLVGLVLPVAGCLGTETGNPSLEPPDPPILDEGSVDLDLTLALTDAQPIKGEPGAVTPASGTVVVFDLDSMRPPETAPVAPDGSFEIEVTAALFARARIEIVGDGVRSAPLDVVLDDGLPPITPTLPCLVSTPTNQLPVPRDGTRAAVTLRNDCDAPVTVTPPRLRRDVPTFVLGTPSTTALEPGDQASFDVVAADALTEAEVVLIDVDGPQQDLRAITVYLAWEPL